MADEHRESFDRVLRAARGNVKKWEAMTEHEKRVYNCELREAIAGALNDAYYEQRAGHVNYRLTAEDVLYARRVAVWMRFGLSLWEWGQVPENAAAADLMRRVSGLSGPSAILSDEVKRRLETRPKAPDTWDPPYLKPEPHDKPADWPDVTGMWSVWIADLIRIRASANSRHPRQPGEDVEQGGAA